MRGYAAKIECHFCGHIHFAFLMSPHSLKIECKECKVHSHLNSATPLTPPGEFEEVVARHEQNQQLSSQVS